MLMGQGMIFWNSDGGWFAWPCGDDDDDDAGTCCSWRGGGRGEDDEAEDLRRR